MSLNENARGPLVWLDMDQSALDAAYDQTVWAPNQGVVAERRNAAAADAYARLKRQRVSYGATPIEAFDLYSCGADRAPIVIFIHGGAWRSGDASVFAIWPSRSWPWGRMRRSLISPISIPSTAIWKSWRARSGRASPISSAIALSLAAIRRAFS